MQCRFCKNSKFNKHFFSTNENIEYSVCENCECHNKSKFQKFNYDDSNKYWANVKDPDGKIRNITSEEERNFKIKNWYGDVPNFINSYDDPKVLDVGCGLGYLLSCLKTKYKFGLEPGSFACETIKKDYPDIKIFNKENNYIKEIKEEFDIIVAYHVIEHLDDPLQLIKDIKNKLKKNGKIIIGTPLIGGLISNYFGKNFRLYNKGHEILFNMKSLKKLFQSNGFKIIKIEKPFFKTDYFNFKNIIRLFNRNKISPPFYGSIVTVYGELQ
tara:strand:- start:2742 stop:3551 length:810 start_codon:yes stop_codon:yes gene_type:complete